MDSGFATCYYGAADWLLRLKGLNFGNAFVSLVRDTGRRVGLVSEVLPHLLRSSRRLFKRFLLHVYTLNYAASWQLFTTGSLYIVFYYNIFISYNRFIEHIYHVIFEKRFHGTVL